MNELGDVCFHIPENLSESGISVFCGEHDMKLSCSFPVCIYLTQRLLLLSPGFPHQSFQVIALPGFTQLAAGSKSGSDKSAGDGGHKKAGINNGT